MCVGLLSTSILRLLPCRVISVSKREILLSSSSSIVKEILGLMLFKELRKLVITVFFNYGKTVVKHKAFPCFWFCLCRFNSSIFNDFHAYVSHNRTNWATHNTAMNLFVSHVVINN